MGKSFSILDKFQGRNLNFWRGVEISVERASIKGTIMKIIYHRYIIASIEITNIEIFAFIAVLVFKLLSHKLLFINKKDNIKC